MNEDEAVRMWAKTLEVIREKSLGKAQDSQLCAAVQFLKSTGNIITVTVPSRYHRDQLEARGYIQQLQDELSTLANTTVTLEVLLDADMSHKTGSGASTTAQGSSEPISGGFAQQAVTGGPENASFSHRLNPDFTFGTFVVGDNNRYACNAAKAVTDAPGKTYNPLLIYGGVGLGKTHLMHAIGNVLSKNRKTNLICVTAEEFMNEYVDLIVRGDKNGPSLFRKKYRNADILLIDDIHFFQKTESAQEELFYTYEALYKANKAIVFTCDRPINELKNIQDRLRTRFTQGLTTNLDVPSYEVRKAILGKTLILQKKTLSDEITDFLAQNISSNVRDLKGALNSVLGYTEMTGQKPSIDIAKKFLVDSFRKISENQITIEQVQRAIAEHYHLAITDLKSSKRSKSIALARHIAIYTAKELTGASDTQIGKEFGGRDPSTVNHSRSVVQDDCAADGEYDEMIKMLVRRIRDNAVVTK